MKTLTPFVAAFALMPALAWGQSAGGLTPVRELYESASYEAALDALDAIPPGERVPAIEAEQYRVFCLVALGRSSEAERAIERIVAADPMYEFLNEFIYRK